MPAARPCAPAGSCALFEPGEAEWKQPVSGFCGCGCGRWAARLHHHHVILAQHIRIAGGDVFNPAAGMYVHPVCHMNHHAAAKRIPLSTVPLPARLFAERLFGRERAALYFERFYGGAA